MNTVWIHAGETLASEITALLDGMKIASYYVWRGVLRKDNRGDGTRWDDSVFPGKNWAVQLLCGDEALSRLKAGLQSLLEDEYVRQTGLEVYIQRSERLI
jgi:hypothetical protein